MCGCIYMAFQSANRLRRQVLGPKGHGFFGCPTLAVRGALAAVDTLLDERRIGVGHKGRPLFFGLSWRPRQRSSRFAIVKCTHSKQDPASVSPLLSIQL